MTLGDVNGGKAMKMTEAHYNQLRDAWVRAPSPALVETSKDPAKRYRWDRLWAADMPRSWWNAVYQYASDEHIDTALRAIMAEGNTRYFAPDGSEVPAAEAEALPGGWHANGIDKV